MNVITKEFFKINTVVSVKANFKELFIIIVCKNMEVKIYYASKSSLKHDLVFFNKCRRKEY